MKLKLLSRAKVNLFLRVLGKRTDGYHELSTLFDRISLADDVEIQAAAALSCECSDPTIPAGTGNIAYRAAQQVLEKAGAAGGFRIQITKRIPHGAGLGGGSSNAAAVLQGANELLGKPLDEPSLHGLAARLGADVAFFLGGRMAIGSGIGEILTPVRNPPSLHYVIVVPQFGISTAEVFGQYAPVQYSQAQDPETLAKTVQSGGIAAIAPLVANDLMELVFDRYPQLESIRGELENAGAKASGLSGTGSAVFGLFEEDGAARAAYDVLMRPDRLVIRAHGE